MMWLALGLCCMLLAAAQGSAEQRPPATQLVIDAATGRLEPATGLFQLDESSGGLSISQSLPPGITDEAAALPGGALFVEQGLELSEPSFKVRARLETMNPEGLIGLALVQPDAGFYLAGLFPGASGPELRLLRSPGAWHAAERVGEFTVPIGREL